jgi:hypothetical protein
LFWWHINFEARDTLRGKPLFYGGACRYCVAHGPQTSMVRPHPAVWRTIHGVLVLYVLLLVFLVFQDVNDARAFLKVSWVTGLEEPRGNGHLSTVALWVFHKSKGKSKQRSSFNCCSFIVQ